MEPCIQKNGIIRCTGSECQTILHDSNLSIKWLSQLIGMALWAYVRSLLANSNASSHRNSLRTSTHSISNVIHWDNTHFLKWGRNMYMSPTSGSTCAVKTKTNLIFMITSLLTSHNS